MNIANPRPCAHRWIESSRVEFGTYGSEETIQKIFLRCSRCGRAEVETVAPDKKETQE